jgi:hypothetical protein
MLLVICSPSGKIFAPLVVPTVSERRSQGSKCNFEGEMWNANFNLFGCQKSREAFFYLFIFSSGRRFSLF